MAAKKAKRLIEFSTADNKSTANHKFKSISQTLPKHPFMLSPGNKIKYIDRIVLNINSVSIGLIYYFII